LKDQLMFQVVERVGSGSEIEKWIVERSWNDKV